jgi:hypothetical protein
MSIANLLLSMAFTSFFFHEFRNEPDPSSLHNNIYHGFLWSLSKRVCVNTIISFHYFSSYASMNELSLIDTEYDFINSKAIIKRRIKSSKTDSKNHIWIILKRIWNNISVSRCIPFLQPTTLGPDFMFLAQSLQTNLHTEYSHDYISCSYDTQHV